MPIDPAIGQAVGSFLGGLGESLGSGGLQKDITRATLRQRMREFLLGLIQQNTQFNRTQGLTEADRAIQLQRTLGMAPQLDKAQYLLGARLGLPPQAFQPRDVFNFSEQSQLGGTDLNAIQRANQSYTPGAGGFDPSVIKQVLSLLGYGSSTTTPLLGKTPQQAFQEAMQQNAGVMQFQGYNEKLPSGWSGYTPTYQQKPPSWLTPPPPNNVPSWWGQKPKPPSYQTGMPWR
jgi:hypothetical protein